MKTRIGGELDSTFQYLINVLEIDLTLAEGLKEVGSSTFFQCTGLEKMYLPKSLEKIGDKCFAGCKSVKEICVKETGELPENLEEIGKGAFANCSELKRMIFPKKFEKRIYEPGPDPARDPPPAPILLPEYETMFSSESLDIFVGCKSLAPSQLIINDLAVLHYLLNRFKFEDEDKKDLMTLCTTGGTAEEIKEVRRNDDKEKRIISNSSIFSAAEKGPKPSIQKK